MWKLERGVKCKKNIDKKNEIIKLRKNNVIILVLLINLLQFQLVNCNNKDISEEDPTVANISVQCLQNCPNQNHTSEDEGTEDDDDECRNHECSINQCKLGCRLWESALDSSCQIVCNKTNKEEFELKELYCVMGCNDALNRYFKWLKHEIGTPSAPTLVADTLSAYSLSLQWTVPQKFYDLARGKTIHSYPIFKNYLVQWRYEEFMVNWKFSMDQSIGENSTIRLENLQPYTKYRFRIALLLSDNHDEVLISEQSVIISTLADGMPTSKPVITRCVAVDQTRISVSWKPGSFPNGPILSYVLQIKDLNPIGYFAMKDIPASTNNNFYMFEKLAPKHNYSVKVAMRNEFGEGPQAEVITSTLPYFDYSNDGAQDLKLLVTSDHSILLQGTDILKDDPEVLYTSGSRINGMAIHVSKQMMFVSDESGGITVSPMKVNGEKKTIINQQAGLNFKPSLLSMDWLNDHLYILGEIKIKNNLVSLWQISRCTLEGKDLRVAVAGLSQKPDHFEVDPYNGYLFWVINGTTSDTGLFRIDLGDISNGMPHESKPLQLIKGDNLGAFTIDHTRFRLLVPLQVENTIIAVSLDGKERDDIRKNTQSPLLHMVKSITMANGLFYWTNGRNILSEEYHKFYHSYYHNTYDGVGDSSIVVVAANNPQSQPTPIPVNPPTNVQALLSSDRAKISWKVPHLLGNQGRGAWQNWNYELEIVDTETNAAQMFQEVSGTSYTVKNLNSNITYKFRVAAYSKVGKGPWSQEFTSKTLKSSEERYLILSSNEGLLQSDVIGDKVTTLIPKASLSEEPVTDIAWYEDLLYFVSNSKLKVFNRTNAKTTILGDFDSLEALAVDWIGRKLYWSNPSAQLITRGSLQGEQPEILPIIAAARQIRIDALRGNLYYSTSLSVDTCRLNGKNRRNYYNELAYSGKNVMGLTLDLEKEKIYWLVRSFSESSLFIAPLIDSWTEKTPEVKEIVLEEPNLIGGLNHFSDRLIWLQDEKTVVVADIGGKNLAYLINEKLDGLKAVSVIDVSYHAHPSEDSEYKTNVIPEPVKNHSIHITGTWKIFNISWDPVQNVNFGKVYYWIHVKVRELGLNFTGEVAETTYQVPPHYLRPYTLMEISIRPFTYWGSASVVHHKLYSPPAPPKAPQNPRVYIEYLSDPIKDETNIVAIFRWSMPKEPNGVVLGFKVKCTFKDHNGIERVLQENTIVSGLEKKFTNLSANLTYTFQVLAYTSVGDGLYSEALHIPAFYENPVPKVIVATHRELLEVDLDIKQSYMLVNTRMPVVALGRIAREDRLFWFTENNELISYKNHIKSKPLISSSEVLAMTVDWIERIVYWSVMEHNMGIIYSYNLNRAENIDEHIHNRYAQKVLEREGTITDLVVSPFDRKLFWIENFKNLSDENNIYYYHLDTKILREFFENPDECLNKTIIPVSGSLVLSTSAINPQLENVGGDEQYQSLLIFADTHDHFIAVDIKSKECYKFENGYYSPKTNLAKDSVRLYWITEEVVYGRNDLNQQLFSMSVPGATKLLSFYQQSYPKPKCLYPDQNVNYRAQFIESTEDSIKIKLPKARLPVDCYLRVIPIKYSIYYTELKAHMQHNTTNCMENVECHMVHSYEEEKLVMHLKPYTKYFFQVGLSSVYGNELAIKIRLGSGQVFQTQPGRPSQPRQLSAITLSFSEIRVTWMPPQFINSPTIDYEVHWQTETFVEGVKNKHLLVAGEEKNGTKITDGPISVTLSKLLPNQSYKIWVIAYATKTAFSESDFVTTSTFPGPENLVLNTTTPYNMTLRWNKPEHVFKYVIQYSSPENSDWIDGFSSESDVIYQIDESNRTYYFIGNLLPKTKYQFSLKLYYAKSPLRAYRWPPQQTDDSRYVFETLGDAPSSPGKPKVKIYKESIYQIVWDLSRENGALIEEYLLESKIQIDDNLISDKQERVERAINDSNSVTSFSNKDLNEVHLDIQEYENMLKSQLNPTTEHRQEFDVTTIQPDESESGWFKQYSGRENYWIVNDLDQIADHIFRVRARNSYGWGPFSVNSDIVDATPTTEFPNNSNLKLKDPSHVAMLIIALPISIIVLFFVFAMILVVYRKHRNKKLKEDSMPIPDDLELTTLRDLHTGENLIQCNRNILYNHFYGLPQLNDAELLELPQIKRNQITMTEFLGAGAFGEVHGGVMRVDGDTQLQRVAVKTLRKGASEQEKWEFLQEAQLMSNFKHDHILRLIGVCLDGLEGSIYIVMELMEGGDLLSYLRMNRPTVDIQSALTLLDLISMCVDVASGCRYLEELHYVHRDIACRNCLVSSTIPSARRIVIGDFGLARDIYKNDYYRKEGEGLLPVRWMSPESLVDGVFTSQSDIWAFGILCWEIMTMGQQPYPARTNIEVLHYVRGGGRLDRPIDCPDELYQLMLKCWNYSAEQRPTFRYCLEVLKTLQSRTNQYAKITAQFTADAFKYWSSTTTDSSGINSGVPINPTHVFRPIHVEASNSCAVPKATPVPKYLELMYDDSQDDNSSRQSVQIQGLPQIPQGMVRVNSRDSQFVPVTGQDGYEIPLTNFVDDNNDSNNNFKNTPVSRSHSNSSTLPSVDPDEIRKSLEKTLANRNSHPLSLENNINITTTTTKQFINNSLSNENLIQHNVA